MSYRRAREGIEASLLMLARPSTRREWTSWLEGEYALLQVLTEVGELSEEELHSLIAVLIEAEERPAVLQELSTLAARFPEIPFLVVGSSPRVLGTRGFPEELMLEYIPSGEYLRMLLPLRVRQAYAWHLVQRRVRLAEQFLREVQEQLSVITHDLNNPVAIISGNAQLLLELSAMMELDPEFFQSLRDIEEASLRIAQYLRPAGMLKNRIIQFLSRRTY